MELSTKPRNIKVRANELKKGMVILTQVTSSRKNWHNYIQYQLVKDEFGYYVVELHNGKFYNQKEYSIKKEALRNFNFCIGKSNIQ